MISKVAQEGRKNTDKGKNGILKLILIKEKRN
jgi:hypothetical protein